MKKLLLGLAAAAALSVPMAATAEASVTLPAGYTAYEQINCYGGTWYGQVIWNKTGTRQNVMYGLHTFHSHADAVSYGQSLGATTFYVQPGC